MEKIPDDIIPAFLVDQNSNMSQIAPKDKEGETFSEVNGRKTSEPGEALSKSHTVSHRPKRLVLAPMIWLLILIGLTGSCLWLAQYFSNLYGTNALWIFGGIGIFAILAIIWTAISLQKTSPSESIKEDNLIADIFMASEQAALVTREGQFIMSNPAYQSLVSELGLGDIGEGHPLIDKFAARGGKEASEALFRLHNLGYNQDEVEETLDVLDVNDRIRHISIRVKRLPGHGRLWQIKERQDQAKNDETFLSRAPIGLLTIDQTGQILAINNTLENWLGLEKHEAVSHLNDVITNPEALLESPRSSGRTVRAETRLATRKGVVTPAIMVASWREIGADHFIANIALHGHTSLGQSVSGQPVSFHSVAAGQARSDKSGSYKSDETSSRSLLHNQEHETAMAAFGSDADDFMASPIAILDLDQTDLSLAQVQRFNAAFRNMTSREDWQGGAFADIFNKTDKTPGFLSLNASECTPDAPYDAVLSGEKGISVSVYIVPNPVGDKCRIFLVDISARKSLEDQLVQSQKMQAIGRLVAEIAHDFNNLLAAMRLYTDTLLGRHPIGDPSYPELQQINSNVNRAASLVKKLLAYSRKQTIRAVKLNVSETLSDLAVTLKQVLGERVRLDIVHGRDLPPIKIDKNQLDTILMNLAVNARDAMKDSGGGKITIKSHLLKYRAVKEAGLRSALEALKGDQFIEISVEDTGTGITDEIKSRIFEPFFTTKAQGEGTGLGLATVYGIVQQSGGHLAVESELGVGTVFTLYFPVYDEEDEEPVLDILRPSDTASRIRPPADLAGQGNILFVEDEASVRVIAAKTLRKRGYNVVEAEDGEEALRLIEEMDEPFDLMISDVVMPGMDGPTLLKKGRDKLRDARIVFISGYAEEEFSDLLSQEPDVTFLPKPFSLIQLAEKVKAEIGESYAA